MAAGLAEDIPKLPAVSQWLQAFHEPSAALYTFSSCIALADLNGDGDHKLIIADLGAGAYSMKLKVYTGTTLISETAIIDLPTGVVSFHMDLCEPRVPAVGVASGAHIYVYKNLRPYFKFTLPPIDVNPMESDIWNQAKNDEIDIAALREMLEGLRNEIGDDNLTARSQRFLMLDREVVSFANMQKTQPLKKQTVITCINILKKSMSEDDAVCCLVLGTENKTIYILDPEAFTILATVSLPSVPVFLTTAGLFDVEYRITVSCRNGRIYSMKRGTKEAKLCFEVSSQPVGLEKIGKHVLVACADSTLQCFSTKGKQIWCEQMEGNITAMVTVEIRHMGLTLIAVATNQLQVVLFSDKYRVDSFSVDEAVTAMKFGRFGREENCLILVTKSGGLMIKILKRAAKFDINDGSSSVSAQPTTKLSIPKKTKLFVDQTMRERENYTTMHRIFQQDLYRLRLDTARAYVEALESSSNPISLDPSEPIKVSARLQGLGPIFCLKIELENISADGKVSNELAITFQWDTKIYSVEDCFIPLPMLIPGVKYVFRTIVTYISELAISDVIKVIVMKMGKSTPIVMVIVNMPISEPATGHSLQGNTF